MGSMFSENTLMLYDQQDLQLGPYSVEWLLAIDLGLAWFPINYFVKWL